MFAKPARHLVCAAALVAAFAASTSHAQVDTKPVVRDYDVFVDLPTAFAFIKLPTGWKFIGKLDAEQLRHLPAGTITSLLPAEESDTRMAGPVKARDGKS